MLKFLCLPVFYSAEKIRHNTVKCSFTMHRRRTRSDDLYEELLFPDFPDFLNSLKFPIDSIYSLCYYNVITS